MRNRIRVASTVANQGKRPESGFTIIELAVGIVVFTIVMGSIYGLMMVARGGRINTNQRSEILQNARIAINTMSRDAINAGVGYPYFGANVPDNELTVLLGGTNDTDTSVDVLTQVYARNGTTTNGMLVLNGVANDQVSFLYIDDTFNGGVSLPVTTGTDVDGRNVTITAGNNSVCTQGDIYLISGQSGVALGMLKDGVPTAEKVAGNPTKLPFAVGDKLGINNPGGSSTIAALSMPGSVQRVFFISYFLVADVGSTTTGTLMRRVYGGTGSLVAPIYPGWVDQPLAYGIESLQFQYVLKDGTVVDIPAADSMYLIRQVRLSVTVRSPDIDPATNLPYRTTLSSTFSTRNLAYEKF